MPSVTATPAQLSWAGGEVSTIPLRVTFEPAVLRCEGGFIAAGSGAGVSLEVPDIGYLGRLRRNVPITAGPDGVPTPHEQVRQKKYAEATEKVVLALASQVQDNTLLLGEVREAQKQAEIAKEAANKTQRELDLTTSRTDPINVISASSDGTITIAGHDRIYGNGEAVAVNGGSLTGYSSGEFIRVSYEDASREGGSVLFMGTTGDVSQSGATHVVGGVVIPSNGEPPSDGVGSPPPGYVQDPEDLR
mgnify:CR=1 FL=1